MTAHTPGPWEVEPKDGCVYKADSDRLIANVAGPSEREANARLIAAAPFMLDALRKISLGNIDPSVAARIAGYAVVKAEGSAS